MESMYYIGLDVHKKLISYCVKDAQRSNSRARHRLLPRDYDLDVWMKTLPAAVDGSDGSHHVHGLDLRSSEAPRRGAEGGPSTDAAGHRCGKKEERSDRCGQDLLTALRCDFLPESYMVSTEIRERRRTLRYRNLLVQQAVQLKNRDLLCC